MTAAQNRIGLVAKKKVGAAALDEDMREWGGGARSNISNQSAISKECAGHKFRIGIGFN
jgi:hypothetical protein